MRMNNQRAGRPANRPFPSLAFMSSQNFCPFSCNLSGQEVPHNHRTLLFSVFKWFESQKGYFFVTMGRFLMQKRPVISESKRTLWILRIAVFVLTLSFANWMSLTTGRSAMINDKDVMDNNNLRKVATTMFNKLRMSNRGLITTIKIELHPGYLLIYMQKPFSSHFKKIEYFFYLFFVNLI